MPINPYFQTGALIGSQTEASLLDDLVVEGVQVHGISMLYLPRTSIAFDKIYGEDVRPAFTQVVEIEMYLKSFTAFEGDGDFFSNMGVEIRDAATFSVAVSRFLEELGPNTPHGLVRPREGDLLWYPLNQKLFEIKYADKFAMHYPLGSLFVYDLKVELFEYSGQTIQTGVPEIDRVTELSQDILQRVVTDEEDDPIKTEAGDYVMDEDYDQAKIDPLDDAAQVEGESDEIINFDEIDVLTENDRW